MSWKFLSVKLGTFVLLHHLLLLQICILNTITITIKQLTHKLLIFIMLVQYLEQMHIKIM